MPAGPRALRHRPSPAAPPTESAAGGDGSARVRRGRPAAVQGFRAGPRVPRRAEGSAPGIGGRRDRRRHRRRRGRVGIGGRRGRVGVGGPTGRAAVGQRGWRWAPAGAGGNPLAAGDAALLEAVSRHEFLLNGLRNRDLRGFLYRG